MSERTMRVVDNQTRPGWVLVEVIEDDVVVHRIAVPRDPLVIPGRDDA